MRSLVVILLIFSAGEALAQQGRHELPIDTISIGGKEQDVKMTHREGYDDLLQRLVHVRDSISDGSFESGDNRDQSSTNPGSERLSEYKERLDKLIAEMKTKDKDEKLMKQGFALLNDIRREAPESDDSPSQAD